MRQVHHYDLLRDGGVRFLEAAGFDALIHQAFLSIPSSTLGLPSWVPDWTCPGPSAGIVPPILLPLPFPDQEPMAENVRVAASHYLIPRLS